MQDFKNYLTKEKTLLFPTLGKEHKLTKLLDSSLDKYTISTKQENLPKSFWGNTRYGLERSKTFKDMDVYQQNNIYQRLTELNLSLSYFIERSGHNYGAKMILLSETQEEKSLYALFVAEEAIHQREFENFMNFTPDPETHWHPMLDPLAKAIGSAEKETCTYIIQVLLEGFGMSFYAGLKDQCNYEPLKKVYSRILTDEARHHGAGLIMASTGKPSKYVQDEIFEYTRSFIKALINADWIGKTINEQTPLSKEQMNQFYQDINYSATTKLRVQKLKEMLLKVDDWGLVAKLEQEKL